MKKIAILMAVAAVAALSPIQVQPAQAMSAAQANALVAQQNYLNSLQANQGYYGNYAGYGGYNGYANYGGATVNPDGSFSNNGVSWNGADPAGGWRGGNGFRSRIVSPYYGSRVLVVPTSHRRWR